MMNEIIPEAETETEKAKEKRRKERMIHGLSLNLLFSFTFGLGILYYAMPGYEEISANVAISNEKLTEIQTLRNDGVTTDRFMSELSKAPNDKAAAKGQIFQKEKVEAAMRDGFDGQTTYYEWLNAEASSGSLQRMDKIIAERNEILGNVIPTYAEVIVDSDEGFDTNRITVATFIKYVEEQVFKKFRITSYSPLGIERVNFDNSKNTIINIGTFEYSFDMEAPNEQLSSLLEFVQTSGKIVIENGKLVPTHKINPTRKDKRYSELNNFLISIDEVSMEKPLTDPEYKNKAKMKLVFYVKGRNYASFVEIRKMMIEFVAKLKSDIQKSAAECTSAKEAKCKSDIAVASLGGIRSLVSEITALDKKGQELIKNTNVSDLNAEFERIFEFYASAKTVEATYLKHKSAFEKSATASQQKNK